MHELLFLHVRQRKSDSRKGDSRPDGRTILRIPCARRIGTRSWPMAWILSLWPAIFAARKFSRVPADGVSWSGVVVNDHGVTRSVIHTVCIVKPRFVLAFLAPFLLVRCSPPVSTFSVSFETKRIAGSNERIPFPGLREHATRSIGNHVRERVAIIRFRFACDRVIHVSFASKETEGRYSQ